VGGAVAGPSLSWPWCGRTVMDRFGATSNCGYHANTRISGWVRN